MRITYCPRGHRTEVVDEGVWPRVIGIEEIWENDKNHFNCDECWDLIYKRKPVKAKRSGES